MGEGQDMALATILLPAMMFIGLLNIAKGHNDGGRYDDTINKALEHAKAQGVDPGYHVAPDMPDTTGL